MSNFTKQTCPKRANLGLLLSAAVLALTTVSGHGAVISGAGGDSKANATVITLAELAVGVSCPGNTLGADNSFFNPASPSLPFAYNGPDLWFTFTTTTSESFFTMTPPSVDVPTFQPGATCMLFVPIAVVSPTPPSTMRAGESSS